MTFNKVREEFPIQNSRAWDYPKIRNERFGWPGWNAHFSVCTDTGFACYSLKSHIQSHLALLFLKKQGRNYFRFFQAAPPTGSKKRVVKWEEFLRAVLVFCSKNVRCSLKGDQKYARTHTPYPLPVIQKYYESEEGKDAFAEWKAKKQASDKAPT